MGRGAGGRFCERERRDVNVQIHDEKIENPGPTDEQTDTITNRPLYLSSVSGRDEDAKDDETAQIGVEKSQQIHHQIGRLYFGQE